MTLVDFRLDARVAIITGAGGGLGRAVAEAMAEAGAIVICADIDAAAAHDTAARIGESAEATSLDVRDRAAFLALASSVATRHGRLDVMCNIAGLPGNHAEVVDLDEAEVDRLVAVNVKGVLFGCQAALSVMTRQGSGSIINMASSAIDVYAPGLATYTMTKAAVAALTKVLAQEAGPHGIRVNAVAPGWVDTPLARSSMTRPDGSLDEAAYADMVARMNTLSPLGRTGVPSDVAAAFVYLAAPASSFVTGQTLRPNGGASAPW